MHPAVSLIQSDVSALILMVKNLEASNCGGVAVSGLEMAQNSQRLTWTAEEVDARLKDIMVKCYNVRVPLLLFSGMRAPYEHVSDLLRRRREMVFGRAGLEEYPSEPGRGSERGWLHQSSGCDEGARRLVVNYWKMWFARNSCTCLSEVIKCLTESKGWKAGLSILCFLCPLNRIRSSRTGAPYTFRSPGWKVSL